MTDDDELAIDLGGDLTDPKRRSPAERRARRAKRDRLSTALAARRRMTTAEKEAEAARIEREIQAFMATRPDLSPRPEKGGAS